ncbi:MAG: T9SS type A sorting domain-containing protein [Flavobacteriales bacterium]|nr:T9SS type A sorting domain-containing protein [Flavobacteriales bacterium]
MQIKKTMNHLTVLFSSKMNFASAALILLLSSSMSFGQEICPDADVVVSAEGMAFSPAALIVDVGTTVGWVNYGGYHDVNGVNSSITQIPFYNPEDFYLAHVTGTEEGVCIGTHTFTIPGIYFYDCTSYGHAGSGMVANITVMAVVPGCTDYIACNYDITATENDNSCEYAEWGYDCDGNCVIDLDEDGICDTCLDYDIIVVDCECNFFDPATYTVFFINIDEENCIYLEDCFCECYNDEDGDGICDENETIVDELEDLSVMIFPNPVTSTLTITLNKKSTLQVFDTIGKLVEETGVVSSWVLNVSDWEKGLYTVKNQEGKTHKFIVE